MKIQKNIELSSFTTYKIGGSADLFIEANSSSEFEEAIKYGWREQIPFIVIGGGSNLLFDSLGLRGLAIKNNSCEINFNSDEVYADSGVGLEKLLKKCLEKGLGGLEFLSGIPGTLGGAIYGNAGAYGKSISQYIKNITVLSKKERYILQPQDSDFSYRHSRFKTDEAIILGAVLKLTPKNINEIKNETEKIISERKNKHPDPKYGSCGCFFKNIKNEISDKRISAGKLIEETLCAGKRIGDAGVFEKHCNFILNYGNAKSEDIINLAKILKNKVFEKNGISLENEVQVISPYPPFKSISI